MINYKQYCHRFMTADELHVWHLETGDNPQALMQDMHCLSPREIDKSKQYRFEKDRIAYITRHVFLRKVLACYLEIDCTQISFKHNTYGKPFIDNHPGSEDIQFNLSKSRHHVLLAVTRNRAIGCDIEKHDQTLNIKAIASNFFSAEETRRILQHDNRHRTFFDYWAAKEAYIKAHGSGLSLPLDAFTLQIDANGNIEIPGNTTRTDDSGDWRIKQLNIADGFSTAIAVAGSIDSVRVIDIRV